MCDSKSCRDETRGKSRLDMDSGSAQMWRGVFGVGDFHVTPLHTEFGNFTTSRNCYGVISCRACS
jgi:hypothetical protein